MDNPTIEKKTIQFDEYTVNKDNNVADVNDVINVLTVVTSSDKDSNVFDKPEATAYLKAAGLIEEVSPNAFRAVDKSKCEQFNDYLSNYMTNIIAHYASLETPKPQENK